MMSLAYLYDATAKSGSGRNDDAAAVQYVQHDTATEGRTCCGLRSRQAFGDAHANLSTGRQLVAGSDIGHDIRVWILSFTRVQHGAFDGNGRGLVGLRNRPSDNAEAWVAVARAVGNWAPCVSRCFPL